MEILHVGSAEVFNGIRHWLAGSRLEFGVTHATCVADLADARSRSRAAIIICDFPLVDGLHAATVRNLAGSIGAPLLAIASVRHAFTAEQLEELRPDAYSFREHPQQIRDIARQLLENRSLRRQLALRNDEPTGAANAEPAPVAGNVEAFSYSLDELGCIVSASTAAMFATGRTDAAGRSFLHLLHPEDVVKFSAAFDRAHHKPSGKAVEKFRMRHLYGHYLWVDGAVSRDAHRTGHWEVTLRYRGTTGNEESHRDLLRMNRLYAIVSSIRQVVATTDEESVLHQEICRIATSDGSFRLAYIGLLDDSGDLRLKAHSGLSDADLERLTALSISENVSLNRVFNTGGIVVCNDIQAEYTQPFWKAVAIRNGIGSFIVLPLRRAHTITGMVMLAAPGTGFFNDHEISLLTEAAADISFKLDVLEKERLRQTTGQRLLRNERRLREAQEIAHLGSWEVDFRTGRAEWTDECLRIFGLPVEENVQSYEVWISHIHPDDLDYVRRITAEAAKTLSPSVLYHRILRTDGSIRYLHSEAHYILDEHGKPVGLHGIAHDITDLKEKELRLRESEERYSTLFYDCPQPKWLFDMETYRFVHVNRAAVEKYGYSEAEFQQMTIFDIRPKEDSDRVLEFRRRDESGDPSPRSRQFRHFTKSGEMLDVEIYSKTILLNDKAYRLVIAVDVTAVTMYEDRMTSAVIQAQENERYEIGAELHDNVCQILAASLMRLAMLRKSVPGDLSEVYDKVQFKIRKAIREVRNLSHRLAPASFDESTLATSVALLINTYNTDSGLKPELFFCRSFEEETMSQELKLHLYRIIQEQLSNIVKHAGAAEVLVRFDCIPGHIRLAIYDNGAGFDPNMQKSGIGLSNMKRRVDLFRGVFQITSAPGHGCRITVLIPRNHPRAIAPTLQLQHPGETVG